MSTLPFGVCTSTSTKSSVSKVKMMYKIFYLFVWNVEDIIIILLVVIFDGDVITLVEQRHDGRHVTTGMSHVVDIFRLVYIEFIFLADSLKCLYS